MRARLYFALALAPGCGRLEFERHALDVETDAAADSVPADALGTCNSLAPFGTPRLIGELSDPAALDGTLRLLPDELTIYVATRPTTATAFGAPTIVPNVNTDADDGPSWISPNGCRLYLSSDVAGTNDIYVATRGL
jgi:hypothetical protein